MFIDDETRNWDLNKQEVNATEPEITDQGSRPDQLEDSYPILGSCIILFLVIAGFSAAIFLIHMLHTYLTAKP